MKKPNLLQINCTDVAVVEDAAPLSSVGTGVAGEMSWHMATW